MNTQVNAVDKYNSRQMQKQFFELIQRFQSKPWNPMVLSANPCFSLPIIDLFPNDFHRFLWNKISCNPGIYEEDITNNLNYPWVWKCVTSNPNLSMESLLSIYNKLSVKPEGFWYNASLSPNITIEFIVKNPKFHWHWFDIVLNPKLTLKDIKANPDLPWNAEAVELKQKNLSHQTTIQHESTDKSDITIAFTFPEEVVNWSSISSNRDLKMEHIIGNPNKPWNFSKISGNSFDGERDSIVVPDELDEVKRFETICSKFQALIKSVSKECFNWKLISRSKYISIDFILENNDLPWQPSFVYQNPRITLEDFRQKRDYCSSSYHMTINPENSLATIEDNPDLPWDWEAIVQRPDLTTEFILRNSDKIKDWCSLSSHPNVTMEFYEEHPELPWNISKIMKNPNVTSKFIERRPFMHWDISKVSYKKIDPGFMLKFHFIDWNWDQIFRCTDLDPELVDPILRTHKFWLFVPQSKLFTLKFFKKNLANFHNKSWKYITQASFVTPRFVTENPLYPWTWDELVFNDNFNCSTIGEHELFRNLRSRIVTWKGTIDDLRETRGINWGTVTERFAETDEGMMAILNNPDLPWNYYRLGKN